MECYASKEVLSIEVFFKSIRFPLEHFLPILILLSIKFSLKVLSIKFPLKHLLLIVPLSEEQLVALSLLALLKDQTCGSKLASTFKRPDVALSR